MDGGNEALGQRERGRERSQCSRGGERLREAADEAAAAEKEKLPLRNFFRTHY